MAINKNGEVYFFLQVYLDKSGRWEAECIPGSESDEGWMADYVDNSAFGDTPQEALAQLAAEPLSDEALEQVKQVGGSVELLEA